MMSKDATPVAESVEVTRADREAAADAVKAYRDTKNGDWQQRIRDGKCDDGEMVQAFARYRLAAYEAGRAEGVRAAAEVARNPGFIQARDTEWDEGVNYAKRFIADRLRALSKEPTK